MQTGITPTKEVNYISFRVRHRYRVTNNSYVTRNSATRKVCANSQRINEKGGDVGNTDTV
jgi:hypothetical protein